MVGSAFGEHVVLKDHCTLQCLEIITVGSNFSGTLGEGGGGFLRDTWTLLSAYSANGRMITGGCRGEPSKSVQFSSRYPCTRPADAY